MENIPVTTSAFGQQAMILLPESLQMTDVTAGQALATHLSASTLQALQVTSRATFLHQS